MFCFLCKKNTAMYVKISSTGPVPVKNPFDMGRKLSGTPSSVLSCKPASKPNTHQQERVFYEVHIASGFVYLVICELVSSHVHIVHIVEIL